MPSLRHCATASSSTIAKKQTETSCHTSSGSLTIRGLVKPSRLTYTPFTEQGGLLSPELNEPDTVMKSSQIVLLSSLPLLLIACGGALDANIGGNVTGLPNGTQMVLNNNGTDSLPVSSNGSFSFHATVKAGLTYNVTVQSQPVGGTCTVNNASGKVNNNKGDVTNISVTCTAAPGNGATLGGTVSGLQSGLALTLQVNGFDTVNVNANGSYTFPHQINYGGSYSVTVLSQPSGQVCSIDNPTGSIGSPNLVINNINVSCI